MSKRKSEPIFSCEVYVLVRGHIVVKQVGRFRLFKKYKNIINISLSKLGLNFEGHLFSYFFSWCERKMLANIRPEEGLKQYYLPECKTCQMKKKKDFLVIKFSKS